ncbi:MAG: hypothetical protein WA816_10085 [Bacteroidales bacterium]
MRAIFLVIIIIYCSIPAYTKDCVDQQLNKAIFKDHVKTLKQNPSPLNKEYYALIKYLKKGRLQLLQQEDFNICSSHEFILLEGTNSTGNFKRILFVRDTVYYFTISNSKTENGKVAFENTDSVCLNAGLSSYLLSLVKNWRLFEINAIKGKLGYAVLDGYSYVASKIRFDLDKKPIIETIFFEQFEK